MQDQEKDEPTPKDDSNLEQAMPEELDETDENDEKLSSGIIKFGDVTLE